MQKKMTSMLKENGETTNEREEILSICSDFYKKLYAKTVEKPQDLVEKKAQSRRKYQSSQTRKSKTRSKA